MGQQPPCQICHDESEEVNGESGESGGKVVREASALDSRRCPALPFLSGT